MKTKTIAAVLPLALLLSACTTVEPAYKDIGTRSGSCVEGGPDTVAQKFYDLRIQQGAGLPDSNRLAQLQPYLSKVLYQDLVSAAQNPGKHRITGDLFSGNAQGQAARPSPAPRPFLTPMRKHPAARRLELPKDANSTVNWQDEVLMVREGTCWVVDDIRYLNVPAHATNGSVRQVLENQ